MAEIKETFTGEPETVVTSVSFQEIATGTAFLTYYFADVVTGASAISKILTETVIYSDIGFFTSGELDNDYDLEFEVPFSIEGVASANLWYGSAQTGDYEVKIKLYKVDENNNETLIGTEVSKTISVALNVQDYFSAKYPIPLTTFKAGEKLRINIFNTDLGGGKFLTFFNDPADRRTLTGSPVGTITMNTNSRINLPVKI